VTRPNWNMRTETCLDLLDILVPDFVEIFRSEGKHKMSVILGWGSLVLGPTRRNGWLTTDKRVTGVGNQKIYK
jgi:hypothetical protein